MTKRPLCFLCFLMVLGLGIMNFAGIPLLGESPSCNRTGLDRSTSWLCDLRGGGAV